MFMELFDYQYDTSHLIYTLGKMNKHIHEFHFIYSNHKIRFFEFIE